MSKIQLKFEKFHKALNTLEKIYLQPASEDRINIDATIQRFELTFELAWKYLKEYFYEKGIILHYPKEILKEAFTSHIIDNESLWLQMLNDRNMTSHTYDEKIADEIFTRIKLYVPELKKLIEYIPVKYY